MLTINLNPNPFYITVLRPSKRGERQHKNYCTAKNEIACSHKSKAEKKKKKMESTLVALCDAKKFI